MRLEPIEDFVIVSTVKEEERISKGGIYIPETAQKLANLAEVIAVGPGRITDDGARLPMPVKKGDIIVHAKYAGNEFEVDGTHYLALRLSDVMSKIVR
jgi:chaperonin GroES